jgi:uncharacterized Zn-binding protein involved in type VI secretion
MVTVLVPHVAGPVAVGAPTVLVGMMPGARLTSMATCVGPPDVMVMGSPTVMTQNIPAARITSQSGHGGLLTLGAPTVIIG